MPQVTLLQRLPAKTAILVQGTRAQSKMRGSKARSCWETRLRAHRHGLIGKPYSRRNSFADIVWHQAASRNTAEGPKEKLRKPCAKCERRKHWTWPLSGKRLCQSARTPPPWEAPRHPQPQMRPSTPSVGCCRAGEMAPEAASGGMDAWHDRPLAEGRRGVT